MVSEPVHARLAEAEEAQLGRLQQLFNLQHEAARQQPAISIPDRRSRLLRLERALTANAAKLEAAISSDFGHRSIHETRILEIFTAVTAARNAHKHLPEWAKPEERAVSIFFKPSRNRVIYQPLGVVGVVAPYNFPLYLSIGPLVGALAAGNRVMLKLSELTPRTGQALEEILGEAFGPAEVAVISGGPEISQAFCSLPFDHLLFTGSQRVGRLVMQAASAHPVPVTLELGGKCPVIIDGGINWPPMVKRIMLGKALNAGQICVAPDYVLLPRGSERLFVQHAQAAVAALYPRLSSNPDYTSIASDQHHARLQLMLEDARSQGAELIELNPGGGALPAGSRKIAPTLVLNPTPTMRVCQEEIFGPLLPLVSYASLDEAIRYVKARPRPLALYCFSRDRGFIREVIERTESGSVGVNTVVRHAGQTELPFGGTGESGFGRYHGEEGFKLFSNQRGVMYEGRYTSFATFYPPYGRVVDTLLKVMLKPSRNTTE